MKAYKATDKNMQCRGFQFEMNEEFRHDNKIEMCFSGFHFCKDLIDVFGYYAFHPQNRFFEVEIPNDAEVINGDDKSITNKIKFIRELSSEDIKELTNSEFYVNEDGSYVEFDRTAFYNEHDQIHREGSPAVIYADGCQIWYKHGKYHRVDGPAVVCTDGHQEWYQNGKLHRLDGPARVYANGEQQWFHNGLRHRIDGPARIYANGEQEFWINGIRQNESL